MTLVPDASIAGEYLLQTPTGRSASELLQSDELVAPELLDAEVLSFVRKRVLSGDLTARRGREVLDLLVDWPITRIHHRFLVRDAFELRDNLSACDAIYVACAVAVGGDLVTIDGGLSRAPLPPGINVRYVTVLR